MFPSNNELEEIKDFNFNPNAYIVDYQNINTFEILTAAKIWNSIENIFYKITQILEEIKYQILVYSTNLTTNFHSINSITNLPLHINNIQSLIENFQYNLSIFIAKTQMFQNDLNNLVNKIKTVSLIYETAEANLKNQIYATIGSEHNISMYLTKSIISRSFVDLSITSAIKAKDTYNQINIISNTLSGKNNSNGQESLWLSTKINNLSEKIYPITKHLEHDEKLLNPEIKPTHIEHNSLFLSKLLNNFYKEKHGPKNSVIIIPLWNKEINSIKPKNIQITTVDKTSNTNSKVHEKNLNTGTFTSNNFYKIQIPNMTASNSVSRIKNLPSRPDTGAFEIIKHERTKNGKTHTSWSVLIRGTQRWDASSTNIQDQRTNFTSMAKADNDQYRAVIEAMKTMNIGKNDPVELLGHSQGGLIATQIASTEQINNKYNIVALTTFGSPTGTYKIPENIQTMHFENLSDPVPALDGKPNPVTQNRTTVYFNTNNINISNSTHDQTMYSKMTKNIENSKIHSIQNWVKSRQHFMQPENSKNETHKSYSQLFDTMRL